MSKKKPKTAPSQVNPIGKSRAPFLLWLDSRQAEWILLGVILILASALRFYNSTSPLMWMDEIQSLPQSAGLVQQYPGENGRFPLDEVVIGHSNTTSINCSENLKMMWRMQMYDMHPPFYLTVLHISRLITGDSFFNFRIPSLLPSILCVYLIYLLGKKLFNKWTGLWAALLMALTTPQIIYAQEVRMYGLLTLLVLWAALTLVNIEQLGHSIKRSILIGVLSCLILMTHYYSVGFLLALGLYSLIRFRGKKLAYTLGGFLFGAILFGIILGPFVYAQTKGPNFDIYLTTRQNVEIAKKIPELVAGWTERLFFNLPSDFVMRPIEVIFIFLLPIAAIIWRKNLLFPWIWVLATVGFVVGMDLFRDTFQFTQIRYTLIAAPAVYLIAAAGIAKGPGETLFNSILPALLSVLLIFNIPHVYTPCKERWIDMAELLKSNGSSTDAVILPHLGNNDKLFYWTQVFWNVISLYSYDAKRPLIIPTKTLSRESLEKIGWGKEAWLITRVPEFPESLSVDWPLKWVPGCTVISGSVAQAGATVFKIKLPEAPSLNE